MLGPTQHCLNSHPTWVRVKYLIRAEKVARRLCYGDRTAPSHINPRIGRTSLVNTSQSLKHSAPTPHTAFGAVVWSPGVKFPPKWSIGVELLTASVYNMAAVHTHTRTHIYYYYYFIDHNRLHGKMDSEVGSIAIQQYNIIILEYFTFKDKLKYIMLYK